MAFEGISAMGGSKYETALQAASRSGNLEIVKLLRAKGANQNALGESLLQF
jgi:ankyrin repeat protein